MICLVDILGKCCITSFSDLVVILGTVCAKWNCRAIMWSGSVYDTADCTLHDYFILEKEDAVRFVAIFKKGYGGRCGLKWWWGSGGGEGVLRLGIRQAVH